MRHTALAEACFALRQDSPTVFETCRAYFSESKAPFESAFKTPKCVAMAPRVKSRGEICPDLSRASERLSHVGLWGEGAFTRRREVHLLQDVIEHLLGELAFG